MYVELGMSETSPANCSVTENLVWRMESRVEWSTESNAELRSSRTRATT